MDEYTAKLEKVVKQMLTPLSDIPLPLVISALSGCSIIPFNSKDEKDKKLLETLISTAILAGKNINKTGIKRPRPNEVGNDIETFVKAALNNLGCSASVPVTSKGGHKGPGYPDIEFTDEFGRANYLECKSFNAANVATTQRSFYLSPSDEFKVTKNAHHFILSYQIYTNGQDGNNTIFRCKQWKIIDANGLDVDVKYEFNSDNARLYHNKLLLAEGSI